MRVLLLESGLLGLVLLALLGASCGPSTTTRYEGVAAVSTDVATDWTWTATGNAVSLPASLHARPDLQAEAVRQIEAALVAHPDPRATFTVQAYPCVLPAPQINPFDGKTITTCTSWTDLGAHEIHLSWEQDSYTHGAFRVEDAPYEIANDLCSCESGLR